MRGISMKEASNLHEYVHRHLHKLGESAGLTPRLETRMNAISGVGYFRAFTLGRARCWIDVFLSIGTVPAGGFGGHERVKIDVITLSLPNPASLTISDNGSGSLCLYTRSDLGHD